MTAPSPDLWRSLAAYIERPSSGLAAVADALGLPEPDAADHTETFVLNLYPYASVWVGAEGMLGGEATDRVAGFWRALGLVPPAEPDHLAALLGLYATLVEAEQREPSPARRLLWRRSRSALLWEHLLSWLGPWRDELARVAPPSYRAWAGMLWDCLTAEAADLGPLDALPLHLRAAPAPPSPEDGLDALVRGLLASGRSGLILTRHSLGRASAATGLGLRIGERAFVLKALLQQDPGATLSWLVHEAGRWVGVHATLEGELGAVARAWRDRAQSTAGVLAGAGVVASAALS